MSSTAVLRLPPFKEFDDIFRADSGGRFELPFFLAHHGVSVWVQDGQAGNSFLEGNVVFLCKIQVLVIIPNIDMNHVIVLIDERGDLLGTKRCVQDMAVIAPISTENQNDTFMVFA